MSKEMKLIPELRFPEFENHSGWKNKMLGDDDISTILRGGSPRPITDYVTNSKDGLNWLKIGDVDKESKFVSMTEDKVLPAALSKTREVFPGDLIMSNSMSFGRPYILKIQTCIHDGWIAVTEINQEIDTDFLYYLILSDGSQRYFTNSAAGGGIKNLNAEIIKKLPIAVPSIIEEQQKIASCLSSLDELIAAHNEKLDALKDHKKGLMQNLFPQEGETVPKVRFEEFVGDGEWVEKTLGNEISYFKGFAFKSKDYTSTGRRIVRVSDMGFDYIKNEEKAIFIKEEDASEYNRWELQANDLIITTVGSKPPVYDSLVGRTIVAKAKDIGSLLNQNAVCLRAKKSIDQIFFNSLFKRNEYIHFIKSIIRGNANQGSITLENLFKYQILIPISKEEQQKIASCLSAVDELINAQADKIEQLQQHKKGLMQGLFPKIES